MRKKVFYPNRLAHTSEASFLFNLNEKKKAEKEKRQDERFHELAAYYHGLLMDMVNHAMSKISPGISESDLETITAAGESAWKTICSQARARNSAIIKLRNESFRENLIKALKAKYPEAAGENLNTSHE